jgi:hypothetical protein
MGRDVRRWEGSSARDTVERSTAYDPIRARVAAPQQETLMQYPAEQATFLPLLIVDWSMEHSHRRTIVADDEATSSRPADADARRHRRVGYIFAKALAPIRLIGAR